MLAGVAAGLAATPARSLSRPLSVTTLEWTATETLLALGMTPSGAGDVPDYMEWVAEPPMPSGVVDLGSRFEPNRELIQQLRPELIVVTNGYGFTPADWEAVAPVHELFPIAPEGADPIAHAKAELIRLGERVGRAAHADTVIEASEALFDRASANLRSQAGRPVLVTTIFEERGARLYGGGLIDAVLRRLGLTNAWTGGSGPWGFAQTGFERLAALPDETTMILLDPIPEPVQIRLDDSSLWPNLPVVRAGRVKHIDPVWPFGGLTAATRFARLISEALTQDA